MNEKSYAYTHGGNVYDENGLAAENLLDFSANINPIGMPESVLNTARESLAQSNIYPDSECRRLVGALAAYEGVEAQTFFCSNGASDIIFRIVFAKNPKKILVTAPSFADYERAGRASGAEIVHYPLKAEDGFNIDNGIIMKMRTVIPDIVFLCNPNNPTATLTRYDLLAEIAAACACLDSLLVVDECFLDFVKDSQQYSAKPLLETYKNVVILKAFTKIFAMPGLRLGYAMCNDEALIDRLRLCGADWPVSNVAQAAGIAALDDARAYISKSIAYIDSERKSMVENLSAMGLTVYPAYANFIFFHCPWGLDLAQELRKKGVLIRDCANFTGLTSGYYRTAVLTTEKNTRLLAAMQEVQASWQSRL